MELSAEIAIKSTIRQGSIFCYTEEKFETSKPHLFVVINQCPLQDNTALLVCAITISEKSATHAINSGQDIGTFVQVTPKECSFFDRPTMLNCNIVHERTLDTLIKKLEDNELQLIGEIEKEILQKLKKAALASRQVERRLKILISQDLN